MMRHDGGLADARAFRPIASSVASRALVSALFVLASCGGDPCAAGACTDAGSSDAGSMDAGPRDAGPPDAGMQCDCRIGESCLAAGESDPANDCRICDPAVSTSEWAVREAGAACTAGDGAGVCRGPAEQRACCAHSVTTLAVGNSHTCAVRDDGHLLCWGYNPHGQLGVGDTEIRYTPTKVVGSAGNTVAVSAGGHSTCAIADDGTLQCWGVNREGQLGVGDDVDRLVPTKVLGDFTWARVSTGNVLTCGLQTDESLWCWGKRPQDEGMGPGETTPVRIGAESTSWLSVDAGWIHACAIQSDESLWCWGRNSRGQLGLGDQELRVEPTQVGVESWTKVSASTGNHTCGIRSDGSIYCWGYNPNGQLGLGDVVSRLQPNRVGTESSWTDVVTGTYHTCGIQSDGSLYCWGLNMQGEVGVGDRMDRREPTRVELGDRVIAVGAGSQHTCALLADGTVWCWGSNTFGQLGLGEEAPMQFVPTWIGCL